MNNLPKNFVLQLGSLITLYVSIAALLTLIFSTINIAIPDAAAGYWEHNSSQSTMRFSLALLLVFFPVYLGLTRIVNQARRQNESAYNVLTRWLIYLSLLVGGIVILGDLVAIIMTFLEGELTMRFALKALSVLVVIGVVFFYYLRDARGYWQMRPQMSVTYGAVATAVVVGIVVSSLYHLELPSEARERRIDNTVVGDLQDMQWRIEDFYRTHEVLPENLESVYKEFTTPTAPEDRAPYVYVATGETTYELCGDFRYDSQNENYARSIAAPGLEKNYNWDYKSGTWCFEREIDNTYRQ